MKPKILALFLLVVLASCTVTKRKYLPGYTLNWRHTATKTMVASKPDVKPVATKNNVLSQTEPVRAQNFVPLQTTYPLHVGAQNFAPKQLKQSAPPYLKNNLSVMAPADSVKNKPVVCEEAKKSLSLGILAVAIPVGIIVLALLAGLVATNNGNNSAIYLVLLAYGFAILAYIILGIIAVISGVKALAIIKENPGKLSGKSKAIMGILLVALLFVIGVALFII